MSRNIVSNIERIDFIRNHPEITNRQLAEIMGISSASVINIKKDNSLRKIISWTEEQISFLQDNAKKSNQWLYDNMPGNNHPISSIIDKRHNMQLGKPASSKWTHEQITFLKEHENESPKWISEHMPGDKKTAGAISVRKNDMKKEKPGYETEKQSIVKWTDEQVKFLSEHEDMSNPWISKNMPEPRKDSCAVRQKRLRLFGRATSSSIPWSDEEIDFIMHNLDKPNMWLTENKPGPARNLKAIKTKKKNLMKQSARKRENHD